mgnify:CR=1 FL=1|tara:strand:- start:1956 stop:2222 length:267 start_codon:yes stop_codon:yes gene_type:complete
MRFLMKYIDYLEDGFCWKSNSTAKTEEETDPIVESVKKKYDERSKKGIKEYGTTLQNSKESFEDFLNHLQEELIDSVLYLEKLKKMNK